VLVPGSHKAAVSALTYPLPSMPMAMCVCCEHQPAFVRCVVTVCCHIVLLWQSARLPLCCVSVTAPSIPTAPAVAATHIAHMAHMALPTWLTWLPCCTCTWPCLHLRVSLKAFDTAVCSCVGRSKRGVTTTADCHVQLASCNVVSWFSYSAAALAAAAAALLLVCKPDPVLHGTMDYHSKHHLIPNTLFFSQAWQQQL
jgi:hypothetical protein